MKPFFNMLMLACMASQLVACATSAGPTRLAVGVQASKPQETAAAWTPLVQDLGRAAQAPSEVITGAQADVVKALRDQRVDVAWLSSSAAIDAVADSGAEVFAVYRHLNGTEGYRAVLLARADSGIQTLEQALQPGKYRYASGSKTSTSGYLLPQHYVYGPRGTTAEALFSSVIYGGHPANLEAIWNKKVDLAINNTTDVQAFAKREPAAEKGLTVLWESPIVPNDVLLFRSGLPAQDKQRFKSLFLSYGQNAPAQQELLARAASISAFVPANVQLLEPVAAFKFATERAAVSSDTKLGEPQRAAKLAELASQEAAFKKVVNAPPIR